jgi:hypothetical protein
MGGGADLLLALPEQEDEQGLREAVRQRRSVYVCRDDTADGEAFVPCLRISKLTTTGANNSEHPWWDDSRIRLV